MDNWAQARGSGAVAKARVLSFRLPVYTFFNRRDAATPRTMEVVVDRVKVDHYQDWRRYDYCATKKVCRYSHPPGPGSETAMDKDYRSGTTVGRLDDR